MEDMYLKAGQILDMLREIELIMAELYRRFSHIFVQDRVFWEDLSQDEERHAVMVTELKNTLLRNGSPFEVGKINLLALSTYRQGIKSQLSRLQRGELERQNALFIARDFEKTLIEHSFYESIRSKNPEYRAILDKILKENEFHLQKLENYIKTLFPFTSK
jgi:1,2-phenylacetyl-CoA epoxidase catalytic subunit